MQQFFDALEKVQPFVERKEWAGALKSLNEAFKVMLYDESDDPIILDAKMIRHIDDARKITEQLVDLPEIDNTDYVEDTLDEIHDALEAYLQDQIEAESFWNSIVSLARLVYYMDAVADYLEQKGVKIGVSDNPPLSVAISAEGSFQLYARLADDGLSLEEASELQQAFVEAMADDGIGASQLINLGGKLLTGKRFEEAIRVYENIILRFPHETPQCLNAIGACYYYLEEYETAIQYYQKALEAGELKDRVEYNIWESCQSLADIAENTNEQMKWKFRFEEQFPDSKYKIEIR